MYKNKLKEIMIKRNVSNNQLASETSISHPTISNIKNNEFHNISVNVLTELLTYFDISFSEFGSVYSVNEFYRESLSNISFNDQNVKRLDSRIVKNVGIRCYYEPYFSNRNLNFYSKRYSKNYAFSGNIRINLRSTKLTFEIVDFYFYKTNPHFDFDTFYA